MIAPAERMDKNEEEVVYEKADVVDLGEIEDVTGW